MVAVLLTLGALFVVVGAALVTEPFGRAVLAAGVIALLAAADLLGDNT